MAGIEVLVTSYEDLATAARVLWDAAEDGYALDGYSLHQVHDALWAALRRTIDELLEDAVWHASSRDDTTGLGRHLHEALHRITPAGPPPDDDPEPADLDEQYPALRHRRPDAGLFP